MRNTGRKDPTNLDQNGVDKFGQPQVQVNTQTSRTCLKQRLNTEVGSLKTRPKYGPNKTIIQTARSATRRERLEPVH